MIDSRIRLEILHFPIALSIRSFEAPKTCMLLIFLSTVEHNKIHEEKNFALLFDLQLAPYFSKKHNDILKDIEHPLPHTY